MCDPVRPITWLADQVHGHAAFFYAAKTSDRQNKGHAKHVEPTCFGEMNGQASCHARLQNVGWEGQEALSLSFIPSHVSFLFVHMVSLSRSPETWWPSSLPRDSSSATAARPRPLKKANRRD